MAATKFPIGTYLHASDQASDTLLLTGFGPFADVADNPTAELVYEIKKRSADKGFWLAKFPFKIFSVLEVSTTGVDSFICQTQQLRACSKVSIHLGVDTGATTFKLEQCCYNNCSFRVPDAVGNMPDKQCIAPGSPLDCCMETTFDCERACEVLRQEGHDVTVSRDPGRYLCNYVYYRSCSDGGNCSAVGGGTSAIFIHVPPFSEIPLDKQVAFVMRAAEVLCGGSSSGGEEGSTERSTVFGRQGKGSSISTTAAYGYRQEGMDFTLSLSSDSLDSATANLQAASLDSEGSRRTQTFRDEGMEFGGVGMAEGGSVKGRSRSSSGPVRSGANKATKEEAGWEADRTNTH